MTPFINLYFDEHYHAYNVQEYTTYIFKNAKELLDIHACVMMKKEKQVLIATKYTL